MAMTIQDIRQQYPQYSDMSDQQLADSLHQKFYSDMPQDQFYQKIGFNSSASNSQQQSLLGKIGEGFSPEVNYYKGFANSLANMGADVANLLPGVNLKVPEFGQGTAYGAGKIGGNIGGFIAGGEGLDAIRGAAEVLPYIGKAAQALGGEGLSGLVRRAIGNAGGAALVDQNNPLEAGGLAAGLSAATDSIPLIGGYISNALSLNPEKIAQSIADALGQGKSLEDNGKSLAQDIENTYSQKLSDAKKLYNPIFDAVGNKNIYEGLPAEQKGAYGALGNNVLDPYDLDAKDLHDQFINNPTFQNGTDLRKQLGANIRALQKNPLPDAATRLQIQAYSRAQGALDNDLTSYLSRTNPKLANQYKQANLNWFQNIVPYQADRNLFDMAQGNIENPTNSSISSIFKNPEDDIQKVVNDLPAASRNKILYSMLGRTGATKSPQNLVNAANNLDQQGLGSYISPELQQQLGQLSTSITRRTNADRLFGGLGGMVLGKMLGLPSAAGEIGGAAAGMTLAPSLLSKASALKPNSGLYPYLVRALIGATAPGGPQ